MTTTSAIRQSDQDAAQGESQPKARGEPLIGAGESARATTAVWRPMVDWSEVFPGNRGINRDGQYELYDAPIGVRLTVEEPRRSEPLIVGDRPWEGTQLCPLALWRDAGNYHMLYGVWDRDRAKTANRVALALSGTRQCTCYAYSDDGHHWVKPELGLVEYEGSARNNMIPQTLPGSPILDPAAPPSERFRVMGQEGGPYDPDTGQRLDPEEAARRLEAMDREGPAYRGPRVSSKHWIAGFVSADGITWQRIEEPLVNVPSDGGTAVQFDAESGEYFAYIRVAGMGRRAIGFSRTKDFFHWPPPHLVFAPDPQDDPQVSFYGGSYFRYPGAQDLHGMFVSIYHQVTDHMDAQLALSRDFVHWYRPERRAILSVGESGSNEDALVRIAQTPMAVLSGGDWGFLYTGDSILHNAGGVMPRRPGHIAWAIWKPHRLCGIEAAVEGRFTIPTIQRAQSRLRLNYRCKLGGWIKVELIPAIPSRLHPDAQGIEGFTAGECDRLSGDAVDGIVSWRGNSDTTAVGSQFAIRITMFQAKIFAYSC